MDWGYLSSLSTDAAPVISEYEGDWVDEYAWHISHKTQGMSLRTYNFSYARYKPPEIIRMESYVVVSG